MNVIHYNIGFSAFFILFLWRLELPFLFYSFLSKIFQSCFKTQPVSISAQSYKKMIKTRKSRQNRIKAKKIQKKGDSEKAELSKLHNQESEKAKYREK